MDGVSLIEQAHDYSYTDRFWASICGKCCTRKRARIDSVKFDGKWPYLTTAILPDNIIWQNMGVSYVNFYTRMLIQMIIAFVILMLAIFGILELFLYQRQLQSQVVVVDNCPTNITKV